MTMPGRILLAAGMGILLAAGTALLLLSGNVAAAIWMEGLYFPLTMLLPGSVDTLTTMVAVVAVYYFVCSLFALTRSSRRAAILVLSVVVVVNTLGAYAWRRASASLRAPGAPRRGSHSCVEMEKLVQTKLCRLWLEPIRFFRDGP